MMSAGMIKLRMIVEQVHANNNVDLPAERRKNKKKIQKA
jgi:hypothetical protein